MAKNAAVAQVQRQKFLEDARRVEASGFGATVTLKPTETASAKPGTIAPPGAAVTGR